MTADSAGGYIRTVLDRAVGESYRGGVCGVVECHEAILGNQTLIQLPVQSRQAGHIAKPTSFRRSSCTILLP
jgi:hypothetical protein